MRAQAVAFRHCWGQAVCLDIVDTSEQRNCWVCGIAGLLTLDGRPADPDIARAMALAVAHRGPDGTGDWRDGANSARPSAPRDPRSLARSQPALSFRLRPRRRRLQRRDLQRDAASRRARTRSRPRLALDQRHRDHPGRISGLGNGAVRSARRHLRHRALGSAGANPRAGARRLRGEAALCAEGRRLVAIRQRSQGLAR